MFDSIARRLIVRLSRRQEVPQLKHQNAKLEKEIIRLQELLTIDPMTGLLNKKCFLERLERHLVVPDDRNRRRIRSSGSAVLFIDCNNFKAVNDTFGHHVGDAAIKAIARVLAATLRPEDLVARFGGDEFDAFVDYVSQHEVLGLAGRIMQALSLIEMTELNLKTRQVVRVPLSVSIGAAWRDSNTHVDGEALVRMAVLAQHDAKGGFRNGGTGIIIFVHP